MLHSKKKRRLYGVFFVVLGVFLMWVIMPGSQSDLLKTLLNEAEKSSQQPPSNAFVYLLGMNAPPGADPMLLGKKRLPIYQASADLNFYTAKYGDALPSSTPVVAEVLHCRATALNCMAKLFTETQARNDSLNSSGYFVARYNTYKQFRDFRHSERMTINSLYPAYQQLPIGQRLFLLDQIQQIDKNLITPQQMQTQVLADLDYWRTELAPSALLIHKMLVTAMVHADLNMLAEMQLRYGLKPPPLAKLTLAERSMRKVMAGETLFQYSILVDSITKAEHCEQGNLKNLICTAVSSLLPVLYKKEDTANLLAVYNSNLSNLSELPLEALYKQRRAPSWHIHIPLSQYIRNFMGTVFLRDGTDYSTDVFRVTDLNLQIALLNAVSNISATQKPFAIPENIVNPYNGSKTDAYLDPAGGLCLPSAVQDVAFKQNGCIPWH